ncbi:hypothetical protein Shyhy01_22300 [Streptomyces hygroscopicus subsp. hygroscopicus]|uniref:hypothetical protein n=1 Tax=Streptomyces sp. KHY 26 TaxID=3097359 RepID=UPI0024A3FC8B|nr:hypothetical protein [Streptomyces hygroscopicus]GLX49280.1 hypothetical protein Shyhy01_22300 [Streptomyces hygroscopicus subsp. hygroscopicus]
MTYRRTGSHRGAARRSWAAVLALLAAFVVLVHHDMGAAPAAPATAMSAMSGTEHAAHGMTGPDTAALTSAMDHDADGACSGADMQHCTSGAVGSPQWLAPPTVRTPAVPGAPGHGVLAGRGLPGNPHRAPPDLSVLSRLLI